MGRIPNVVMKTISFEEAVKGKYIKIRYQET